MATVEQMMSTYYMDSEDTGINKLFCAACRTKVSESASACCAQAKTNYDQIEKLYEALRVETTPALEASSKALAEARRVSDGVLKETGSKGRALKAFYKGKEKADKAFRKAIAPAIENFNAAAAKYR